MVGVGLLMSIYAGINAFTNIHLSRTARLILSVWSTIIMFAFATDNIIQVFGNPDIESSNYFSAGFYIGIQNFLLGASAVYIMQNFMLLAAFLPSRSGNYKQELKATKQDHIERYAQEQVSIYHSFLCVAFVVPMYWLNYTYELLPRHTMIWLVFLTFPLVLQLFTLFNSRKLKSSSYS